MSPDHLREAQDTLGTGHSDASNLSVGRLCAPTRLAPRVYEYFEYAEQKKGKEAIMKVANVECRYRN